jgi:hypothetical protein
MKGKLMSTTTPATTTVATTQTPTVLGQAPGSAVEVKKSEGASSAPTTS